jgi:tripartite-type tricarboxylate transporter receptor subunit TctC
MASRKFLTRKPTLDPAKDLTPLATTIASVSIVLVNADHPAKNLAQLVDMAKRNPGKLTYGTPGVQSYYYLIGELFRQNGVDMLHVPYKGTAPIVTAVAANEVDIGLVTFAVAQPLLTAGKARALGVLEPRRFAGQPDVPSVSETLPGFRAPLSWFGFFGPPGVPPTVVERLNAEINKALETPDVRGKIAAQSFNILMMKPEQMRPFIAETADLFAKIIKTANIQPYD